MSSIETTDKLSLLFMHKKDKTYIRTVVSKIDGEIKYHVYKSVDGIHDELTSEGVFSADKLPKPVNEIYAASVNLSNYVKKNGFKVCNTISQTKKGLKFS